MGLGNFFKNLFGSAKETASEVSDKAEVVLDKAKETATEYAGKAEKFVEEKIEQAKEKHPEVVEKVEKFTEKNASENTFKTFKSPSLLHVATHGYFFNGINIKKDNYDLCLSNLNFEFRRP